MDRRNFLKGLSALLIAPSIDFKSKKAIDYCIGYVKYPFTSRQDYLIRSSIWSEQIRKILLEDMETMKFIKIINEGEEK